MIQNFTVWPPCLIVFELHQTVLLFSCLCGDVWFVWPGVSNMFGCILCASMPYSCPDIVFEQYLPNVPPSDQLRSIIIIIPTTDQQLLSVA